ncbi:MAG: transposase [Rhodospirillales bacterium]|nr:transposase [Rhodospirillales bacterium]
MYKEIPAKEALWDRYCTEEGKRYLFVAIDRTSKFAYVELHERQTKMIAARFLRNLIAAVPYKLTHILTDNGIRFTNRKCDKHTFVHIFDRVCAENGAEHRLAKVKHLWTNGQVERMNRTIKDAAVKRYHYGSHEELKEQRHASMMAYNFARRLKTLKGLTPYEYVCKIWTKKPERFNVNPLLHNVGLNSYSHLN